jgi:hypothetical protein
MKKNVLKLENIQKNLYSSLNSIILPSLRLSLSSNLWSSLYPSLGSIQNRSIYSSINSNLKEKSGQP